MTVKINGLEAYELALHGERDELIKNGWFATYLLEGEFGETITHCRPNVTPAWWQADSSEGVIIFHYSWDQA